jgi:DNA-binding winged helix-turn-helix (wHTH) protein
MKGREPFRLGNAMIDPVSREAHWDGGQERLQPQTLKVLLVLAARRGEVVTRDELTELCWDGRVVGDDVINRSISLLRHFADRAGGLAIQTVPRAGYRLVEHSGARDRLHRRWPIAAALLALAVLAGVFVLLDRKTRTPAGTLTVAVVPFTAQDGEPISKDLAARTDEAVARMLAESGISVVQAAPGPASHADFLLSGSISKAAAGQLAAMRLDYPIRHAVVLSRRIEAGFADRDTLPDQVGAQLSAALTAVGPFIRLDPANPADPVFVAALLNTYLTDFDSRRAFEVARRSAPSAPDSAIAQLTLARLTGMNIMEVRPEERQAALAAGRTAATRLLRLAPRIGDSYVPWCLLHAEVRLAECEAQLRKGWEVDPHAPSVGLIYGHLLVNAGRMNDAMPVAGETLAKDSYAPGIMAAMILVLDATGRSKEADAMYQRGQRLWPQSRSFFFKRVSGLLARGDLESLARFEDRLGSGGLPLGWPSISAPLARALRGGSLSHARESCRSTEHDDLPATQCMLALARLGDLDASFKLADRLYPRRTGRNSAEEEQLWLSNPNNLDTVYLTGSGAAPMRRDPRFLALADRLGLIRYWRAAGMPDFCTRDHEPVCDRIVGRLPAR